MSSAAFFDLAKILWACSGERAFADYQFRQGGLSIAQLASVICYELGLVDDVDTRKRSVLRALFAGDAPCIDVCTAHFHWRLSPLSFPEIIERVRRHQQVGDKVVIVSAALDFIMFPVAELLNADHCFAAQLEIVGHKFSGDVSGLSHYGEAKASVVKDYADEHGLDLTQCHAYGDLWEDRYMLGIVGQPVAVYAAYPDRRLTQLAQRQQWSTLVDPLYSAFAVTTLIVTNFILIQIT